MVLSSTGSVVFWDSVELLCHLRDANPRCFSNDPAVNESTNALRNAFPKSAEWV